MKVLQFPLLKITLFFVLGILFSHIFHPELWMLFALLVLSFTATLAFHLSAKNSLISKPYFGILIFLTSFCIGAFTLICSNETRNLHHYTNQIKATDAIATAHVIVLEKLKNTPKSDRYIAEIYQLNTKKSVGKILLNIRKDALTPTIAIGSHLKVSGSFYRNKKISNPNQFDYGNYLENKQIYAQLYTDANDVKINAATEKNLSFYASKIRTKIIANLEKNHFGKAELSVVNALILGQQQDISPDIVHDYQYAGAIHVLSVSGLHVGFVLLFITFLLKPFPNTKTHLFLKLIISIVSLWLFGILAGMSPCVVRSVTMFTFVAIGLYLRRSVNIYNTLLVSILLILLMEPSFLFDVGFQLSYVSLFFIVWLQPLFASIFIPKNKIVKYIWDIITVSFAAQIGALPITMYYFHQFSGLFFITNCIILPAMSLILGLGVVVMFLAAFDVIFSPLLKLLEIAIWTLNTIIKWIASFESYVAKDIPISFYMMLSLYVLIVSWIIWFKKPNFKKLVCSFSAIIAFQIFSFNAHYSNEKTNEFIVFTKSRNSLITERNGKNVTVFSNDTLIKDGNDNQLIKSYLVANFCKIERTKSISNLYYFKGKRILIIDSSGVYLKDRKPDILILRNSPKVSLDRIFKSWKPEIVVVDASNFKSYVNLWEATCAKEKIPFHATAEKGFYKL